MVGEGAYGGVRHGPTPGTAYRFQKGIHVKTSTRNRRGAWMALPCLAAAAALAAGTAAAAPPAGFRTLAPGALTVIPADTAAEDTVRRRDLPEVTVARGAMAWKPKRDAVTETLVEESRDRDFVFEVWCLEFAFKLPRLIDVQVPVLDAAGKPTLKTKPCWYMIYRVKNVGWRKTIIDPDDPTRRTVETFEKPIRFMPHFVLESMEGLGEDEGLSAYRGYLDRLVPAAMEPIRNREDPARRFLDSAAMAEQELAPGEDRWGVAVWEDIDPRIDYFSIYVRGLTNATDWKLRPDPQAGSPSLTQATLKSLRLDFWRPGDDRDVVEEEVSIGYAGIFERMTLGTLVLEAVRRPALTTARPLEALEALAIDWKNLVERADDPAGRFTPLITLLRGVAALPAEDRPGVIRGLFGDLGAAYLDELIRPLPAQVGKDRFESLVSIIEGIAAVPEAAARRKKQAEFFGAAAPRLDWLAREAVVARQAAALDATDLDVSMLADAGAQQAFRVIHERLREIEDVDRRRQLILGLFGPEGAALYEGASEKPEGVDHAWVLRYENAEDAE